MRARPELSLLSREVNPSKVKLLLEYLQAGSAIDAGCGNGLYGPVILSRCSELLQLDIADRREASVRRLPFRQMDVQRLDLPDKSTDNVVAYDVIEHLDDDKLFLREVKRVCRGRLIFSVPNSDDSQLRQLFLTHGHFTDKTHRREYTREGLATLLEGEGFRILGIWPQFNRLLPYFARALAKERLVSKIAARLVSWQCLLFERLGLFENRTIADWFCVAE